MERLFTSVILLSFASASIGWSQSDLIGTVSDPLGSRVSDAKVKLLRGFTPSAGASTNREGVFTFHAINAGRYCLEIEAPGFAPYRGPELFVTGNTTVDIVLQIGALKQEMVVSATGSELPISQVGASVSLVDLDSLQSQNKLDVLENLRQVGGAQVVQTGQRGGAAALLIRGGESSFNKIMIDGAPANALGGGFDFAQLSNTGVQSVEILKGPNSVLYGVDALAGVVNIATRRGTSGTPELAYSVGGGNFGTLQQAVSLGGTYRQFDYFSEFSRFDTNGSYANQYFHNATYAGNFGWAVNPATDLRVTYRRNWTDLGSPNAISLFGIADDASHKHQNTYLSGSAQNQTTPRWRNQFRFAYGQFQSVYSNPAPTGTPESNDFGTYLGTNVTIRGANGYSATGQAILDYAGAYPQVFPAYEARRSAYAQSDYQVIRDWTATFGFRYEHENGSGYTRDNYSYFVEGHGSVGRRLYLTGGLGLEDNAVFGFAASPRVSAAYYVRKPASGQFFAETKLRFNYGQGIKEPSTYQQGNQLYALLTPAQRSQFAVGAVGPERSRAFDFGIQQGLWGGRARLDVAGFHNRFYDLITYLDTTALVSIGVSPAAAAASGFGAYVNATSTSSKGMEAQIVAELGRGFRAQGNYTFLDAVVTKAFGAPSINPLFPGTPIGAFAPLQGQRPFRRAPHSGSMSLLYRHRKFTGSFTGYLVSRRDDSTFLNDAFFSTTLLLPNRNLAPAYQKFDVSGRYQLRSFLSVYTSIENLFSQRYEPVFGFPALPFSIRSGLTFTLGGESWRR